MPAMVVWITGLSAAGKTTLCQGLYEQLKPHIPGIVALDGEGVRAAFGDDLTHAEADRVRQVKRLQAMAKLLADQNLVVIVAVLYAHPDLLEWNRENLPGYVEIYLEASLETVAARDIKGLYEAASQGRMPNVVGIDIPWHAPVRPDLHIKVDGDISPAAIADRVMQSVPQFAGVLQQ